MRIEKKSYYQHREWLPLHVGRSVHFMAMLYLLVLPFISLSAQISHADVYAGENTQVCGSGLNLDNLNAHILGVNDGTWSTSGTGYFVSTGIQTERFSSSSTYIPSRFDINMGFVTLRLTADDRNLNDQRDPPFDEVRVDIIESSSMVCRSHLNLNHDDSCMQIVTPSLYLINQLYPDDYYTVELYSESGDRIDSNIVSRLHVGMTLDVKVVLNCNGNSCWGKLTVEDKNPPPLFCKDITVSCLEESLPDSIGFPILDFGFDSIINVQGEYHIAGLDNCGTAILKYEDTTEDYGCVDNAIEVIHRSWSAVDDFNNRSNCDQDIYISNIDLSELVLPPNFDGDTIPPFMCSDSFPITELGYPSPDTTGYPYVAHCSNLQAVYTDYALPLCGGSYKVLREWTIVDWCTGINLIHNQSIYVVDTLAPLAICVDDIVIATQSYSCQSGVITIQLSETIDNCSDFVTSLIVIDTLIGQTYSTSLSPDNQTIDIDPLPIGGYDGHLSVIDECGNRSECKFQIIVEDQSPPVAVCDRNTEVGMQANGQTILMALSLDDGSGDNCSIKRFGVMRESNICTQVDTFADSVIFCCDDIGARQDVTLRVWDMNDNFNDCVVQVNIVDHIVPRLYCPNDITVSCDAPIDLDDLSNFGVIREHLDDVDSLFIWNGIQQIFVGFDGLVKDNCGLQNIQEEVETHISCSEGYIDRNFVVSDHTDQSRSCTQRIHIVNSDRFSRSHITWPINIVLTDCTVGGFNEEVSGIPTFIGDECGMVVSSYKDLNLDVIANSCYTILREWTVIDWCQYDENSGHGIWSHFQEIRIENKLAPIIDQACSDILVCITGAECSAVLDITMSATDDCSLATDLSWNWTLDREDGTRVEGAQHFINENLPEGNHSLEWRVNDGCGNISDSCQYTVTVQDCKAPTIFCHSTIATSFMETSGMVAIRADQFAIVSADNCTTESDLIFSFSTDISDTSRVLTCSEINDGISHNFDLEVWVTDEVGNQDFCQVTVEVRDRGDYCEDITHVSIGGLVYNPEGGTMTTGNLQVYGETSDRYAYIDIQDASYLFTSLPVDETYHIDYQNEVGIQAGLSVIDLVMVQNHILQISPFSNPYQYHAADVNGSKTISAIDLVLLRKVILGISDTFPSQDQWQEFTTDQNGALSEVWTMDNEIEVANPNTDYNLDMVIVKTGDVNFSTSMFLANSEVRTKGPSLNLNALPQSGGGIGLSFEEDKKLLGFQFDLSLEGYIMPMDIMISSADNVINNNHYSISYDSQRDMTIVRFCWHEPTGIPRSFTSLVKLLTVNGQSIVASDISQSVYIDANEMGRLIQSVGVDVDMNVCKISVSPNPIIDDVHVYLEHSGPSGKLSIINHFGETVYTQDIETDTGSLHVTIDRKYCHLSGIYYIKYQTNTTSLVSPFIVL